MTEAHRVLYPFTLGKETLMYFVIEVTTKEQTVKSLFDFPSLNAAKAHLFSFLASSYADSEITYILGQILDEGGNIIFSELKEA